MINIELKRIKETKISTIGELYVDGQKVCYVLEDGYNNPKIYGESRIPAGKYLITARTEGTFYNVYSTVYKKKHPMLWIRNIPGFEYVLIHKGNSVTETKGCLILGDKYFYQADTIPDDSKDSSQYRISGGTSTPAYNKLYALVMPRLLNGEECFITITGLP